MDVLFPEEAQQNDLMKIIEEVLGATKVSVFIGDFILKEDDAAKSSHISCKLHLKSRILNIKGSGDGPVDALFAAVVEALAPTYTSLEGIQFDDFSLKVKFKEGSATRKAASPVEIKLVLKNERNKRMYFHSQSRSLIVGAVAAIRKALEFLINAERAVLQLRDDHRNAADRNRRDLTEKYAFQLAELVQVANYEKLFQKNS